MPEGVHLWEKWTRGIERADGQTWWWFAVSRALSSPTIPAILGEEVPTPKSNRIWVGVAPSDLTSQDLVKSLQALLYRVYKSQEEPPNPSEEVSMLTLELLFSTDRSEEAYSFLKQLVETRSVGTWVGGDLIRC